MSSDSPPPFSMDNEREAQDMTDAQREHDAQEASSHEEPEGQDISAPYDESEAQDVPSPLIRTRTPRTARPTPSRRASSASSVPIDFFDPEGAAELEHPGEIPSARESEETLAATAVATFARGPDETSFDLEKTLRGLRKRREEQAIPTRELGVIFRGLRVEVPDTSTALQPTFGALFDPRSWARKLHRPPRRTILKGVEGVVRPGEMLLVLGAPGSGCSTLLKVLANRREEYTRVDGEVSYDHFSPREMAKHYRGDLIYCPEDDVHFPTLSVGATLEFAAAMRAPQARVEGISRRQFVRGVARILSVVFGLRHVSKTRVGDASLRGVSGGEKKRVSIAEMLALRGLVGAWDNSTRGLDASTALEFVRALRIATDIGRLATIVSIYQAGESLYEHFDKVSVIYKGRMAYFGRADQARQYFIDMGYEPADRQTTADFLVSVTDPHARIVRPGYEARVPRTPGEFAEYFLNSPAGGANRKDIDDYRALLATDPERREAYRASVRAEHAAHAPKRSVYTVSIPMQARAVMARRVRIIRGTIVPLVVQISVFWVQGIIIGTVFFNSPEATSAYFSRGGVLFFALLFSALSAMAEIPALFAQRPIVIKHYRAAMYHPFIEAAALTLVDVPITFLIMSVFSIIIYFLVDLQRTASQFFIFFLFIFTMSVTMKAWFRAVAAALGSPAPAQTVAGILLLALVLYTGYTIPKPSMIGALQWISYINPLRWGFEGIISNEFHTLNGVCSELVPSGAGYEGVSLSNQVCTIVGSQPGQDRVDGNTYIGLSFGYSYSHLWRNWGFVVAFGILFVSILLLFTEINTNLSSGAAVTLFKRGSRAAKEVVLGNNGDEETGSAKLTSRTSSNSGDTAARMPIPDGHMGEKPGAHASEKPRSATNEKGANSSESSSQDQPKEKEKEKGRELPELQGEVFTWRGLSYDVSVGRKETLRLLDDVSGYVAPGKLTALVGESGAGKTTLLNVLAQRQAGGIVHGKRLIGGRALPPDFQAQTGYCQQMDTHLPTTSVREALLFSAKLRQPPEVPLEEKEAYVETVLEMCGMTDYADAIVGSLNVEHRKRTTIGVELAAKPKLLLFLDEPTSGLDSQSAWAIVTFLRELAERGQAILCTIHQPSAELFQVFDRLLLLRKGGQTVYFGDIGPNSRTMLDYFESHGGYPCPENANPAEYVLDVIGAGATATVEIDWNDAWKKSEEAAGLQADLGHIIEDGQNRPPVQTTIHREFSTRWGYQLTMLLDRDLRKTWRNPTYMLAKFLLNIVGGIFIGFTFFKAKDTIQGTQNKLFAVYMTTILAVPLGNQMQVPFLDMRTIYEVRERPSRMYSWSALVTAQILGEIPFNIVGSMLYFFCWYWTVGFPSSRAAFTFLIMSTAFPLYYTTISQAVAALSPSADVAAILYSFLFSFVITFNGVLQPFRQLGWWSWMYRVTPFAYLISAMLGQIVGGQEINCAPDEVNRLIPPSGETCIQYLGPFIQRMGGYLLDENATGNCEFCRARTADQFLSSSFNIVYSHHWWNFGLLWAYIIFNIAAIYAFTWMRILIRK